MLKPDTLEELVGRLAALHRRGVGEALRSAQTEQIAVVPWRGQKAAVPVAVEHALAFANGSGGDLVFGVDADGRTTGAPGGDGWALARDVFARTRPGVACDAWSHDVQGETLIILSVPRSTGVHASADGRRVRRIGPDNVPITPDQDADMLVDRGDIDPSDQPVPELGMEAIDPIQLAYLREILRQKHDQHDWLSLGDDELLTSMGLLTEDGRPKLAAILLVGQRRVLESRLPQVEVVYTHYDEAEEPDHQEHLTMPLLHTLSRLQDCIEARNRFVTLKQGLFHHKIKDFDDDVYREALVNALVHRDYTRRDGTVYIHHHPDRLELANPGGFIGGVARHNILYHAPRHRNRRLAEALLQLGLMERGGHGVNRLYRLLLRRGKEAPQFEDTPQSVHLTLQGGGMDGRFASFVAEEEQRGRVFTLDFLILLSHLKRNRMMDLATAAQLCQRPSRAVGASLAKMVDAGYVERIRSGGSVAGYRLSPKVYKVFQRQVSYFRDRGLQAHRQRALILEVIEEMGALTVGEVQELCATDENGARSLLRRLVRDGLLTSSRTKGDERRYQLAEDQAKAT